MNLTKRIDELHALTKANLEELPDGALEIADKLSASLLEVICQNIVNEDNISIDRLALQSALQIVDHISYALQVLEEYTDAEIYAAVMMGVSAE